MMRNITMRLLRHLLSLHALDHVHAARCMHNVASLALQAVVCTGKPCRLVQ